MLIIIFLILIGLALTAARSYNALQTLAQDVKEKASNIQVAISNKHNQINQLIETVKNYQNMEQLVQLKVSQDITGAGLENSYRQSNTMFATIQGVAEKFPNLKASERYHSLEHSIKECEKEVQQRRERYNYAVKMYNQKRMRIPTIFLAKALGFSEAPYMQFDPTGLTDITSLNDFKTDDGERLQQIFSQAGNKISSIAMETGKVGKNLVDRIADSRKEISPNDDARTDNKY